MISLFGHITVIIGMHNLGYVTYFHLLFRELGMELTRILFDFLKDKEERKEFRRTYKKRLNMKAVWSKKQKKSIEEVLKERTENSYGPGVGQTAGLTAMCKAPPMTGTEQTGTEQTGSEQKRNKIKARCKCGSTTHAQTTHNKFPLRKKDSASCVTPSVPTPAMVSATGLSVATAPRLMLPTQVAPTPTMAIAPRWMPPPEAALTPTMVVAVQRMPPPKAVPAFAKVATVPQWMPPPEAALTPTLAIAPQLSITSTATRLMPPPAPTPTMAHTTPQLDD
jgi:hypothetical protein